MFGKKPSLLFFVIFSLFLRCTLSALFSSSIPIENTSGLTLKLQLDKNPVTDISPSSKSFSISTFSTPQNCTVFMDSQRYVTYKVTRDYFWSQPRFSLYKDANGNYLSVVNGEVSQTDEFIRFGDGTHGVRVKFVASSSGMPPSTSQKLSLQTADSADTANKK